MARSPVDADQVAAQCLSAARYWLARRRLRPARRKVDEAMAILFEARPDLAAFYAAVRRARRKAKRVNPLAVASNERS
jgi:hypothetical protein